MKKAILILGTVLVSCTGNNKSQKMFEETLFEAEDLTAENLFSKNIEGPAVDKSGNLFVVNYKEDGTIAKVSPDGKVSLFTTLPAGSIGNSIQFTANGNMLVADFAKHNVLEVDTKTKTVTVYCHDDRFNQPNDICLNKNGVVFASDPDWKNEKGQLWKIGPDRKATLLQTGMGTTNGICLSPDEKTLYLNESIQKKVWAFNVDEEGNISNQRLFTSFTDHGMDGMKCDAGGNLYITRYGKGTVAIFSPKGEMINEVKLKGKDVSNITFGGKDYKTCFVTLQDRKGMEKFRTDTPGR
jgi:sugar lactone lactonase YvrE